MDDGRGQQEPTLALVRGWVEPERGLSMDGTAIVVDGDPPRRLELRVDNRRVLLTHHLVEEGTPPERLAALQAALEAGSGAIEGTVTGEDTGMHAAVSSQVIRPALNRHTFLAAVHGLLGFIDSVGSDMGAADGIAPAAEPEAERTRVLERAWAPTHAVPRGGVPAWPTPDGTHPAKVTLAPRVQLAIVESKGDWARVAGSNGWTGWVDRRRLETIPKGRVAPTEGRPRSGERRHRRSGVAGSRPLPLLGLLSIGVAAVLPWLETEEAPLNTIDLPLAFLWDVEASQPPSLAWLVLAIAVAAGVLVVTGRAQLLYIPVGLATLSMPLLFVGQVYRAADGSVSDAFSQVGLAPVLALVGGFLLLASARR